MRVNCKAKVSAMNIIFSGKDKGLTDFTWENIPQLAILTGVNGAGKSQLLQLLRNHFSNGVTTATEPYVDKSKIMKSNFQMLK